MSTRTTYYNLTKPDADEHVLRTVINQNYDAIDLQMHANAEAAKEAAHIPADEYDTTATYNPGDFCIYQNTLYICIATTSGDFDPTKWTATTIADEFERKHTWSLFETITADGNERFVYSSELPEGITGVMINCICQAAASALNLGIGYSFNGSSYPETSAVANGINTGIRYSRSWYLLDGNLWINRNTAAGTTAGTTNMTENISADHIGDSLKKVRCYAPADEVIPSGSTFEIYIRR